MRRYIGADMASQNRVSKKNYGSQNQESKAIESGYHNFLLI